MDSQAKILLVDDEIKVINALKRVLNKNDYKLLSTTSAEEAIFILQNNKIDIIICDQRMPQILGIDVLKYSKEILPDAVRILLTGCDDINVAISAINEGGIFYYFSKPWNNEEIISVVNRGLRCKKEKETKKTLINNMEYNKECLKEISNELKSISMERKTEIDIKKIPICGNEDIILINSQDILYLTAHEGVVAIVTIKNTYKSNDSLNSWEKKLGKGSFFRCHRSYIVNIDKIEKISQWFNGSYNLNLKDIKENIPVSRSFTKKLKELLGLQSNLR